MLESILQITERELADLLRRAERAHAAVFALEPHEWPEWYANYMLAELAKRKPAASGAQSLTLSDL